MALRRSAGVRRAVSMTSLIDVIFLLLLFFMLTSTFTRYADVPLVAASRSAGGAAAPGSPPLFLRVTPDALTLNGQGVAVDVLADALRDRVGSARGVILSVGAGVEAQRLVDVLVVAQQVPDLPVQVVQ